MRKAFFVSLILIFLLPLSLYAQRGSIIGKVTDSKSGEALVGANVLIEGTNMGAATATDGTFRIENVPPGTFSLKVTFMGYKSAFIEVQVTANEQVEIAVKLESAVLIGRGVTVTANRAVERETPIAFSTLDGQTLANNYTTGDLPDIIKYVPGVFVSSAGLGESELWVRGFEADKVQIMINGIPVNDPESQHVYWSNWTGLSSNVQSVQVQRGIGSSLYGSGSFGGSVNIETMGVSPKKGFNIRSSAGIYSTQGVESGPRKGRVADGQGGFNQYSPINYNASIRYNSGLLYDGKLNFGVMVERKAGDSYIDGTYYDGYSVGLEVQSIFEDHNLLFSFIGAPQKHNQARTSQDLELIDALGREYNRNNHPYQENYYFKPQWSLRHEWTISEKQVLLTNAFFTMGRGGGKYLRNDNFNVETGEVGFKSVSDYDDNKYFGRHARYIYENTGVVLTGYDPDSLTFEGKAVSYGANLITSTYNHSWQNDSHNDHVQYGLNTYYQHQVHDMVNLVVGGEARYWIADHFAYTWNFRSHDAATGLAQTWHQAQMRYDYTTKVLNFSGFGRATAKPIENLTVMADAQYGRYHSKVDENPIEIFDFGAGKFSNKSYRTTMDLKNADGSPVFATDEYERTFTFLQPKFGANYNVTDELNIMANYSIGYKEPKSYQWYNRDKGPGTNQPGGEELEAEKTNTIEFGVGYRASLFGVNINYYNTTFNDKIESVETTEGDYTTINAGKSVHQGVELAVNANMGDFDFIGSATYAMNRWKKMDVAEIFGEAAADVEDKVVPFSPEIMANASVGYNLGKLRVALGVNFWDEYYATYTNKYTKADGTEADSKLDLFDLSANISFPIVVGGTEIKLRLDLNNITSNDNIMRASYASDYNRSDGLSGYRWYVLQAPLFNAFLTTEISF